MFADSDVVTKKCQDWEYWFKQGWIEVATPMAYYQNANTVTQKIAEMIAKLDNISYNYAGIAPYFMGMNPYEEVVQAVAALSGGSFGTVIFDSKTIMNSPEAVEYLSNGIYGNNAILPHSSLDKLLTAFAEEMKSRKALYGITGEKAEAYDAALDALTAMPFGNAEEIMAIRTAVYQIQTNAREYASGYAITRISEEMENLNKVLDVQLSRYYIDSGEWVPADGLRPDQLVTPPGGDTSSGSSVDSSAKPSDSSGKSSGCGSAGSALAGMTVLLGSVVVSLRIRRSKRTENNLYRKGRQIMNKQKRTKLLASLSLGALLALCGGTFAACGETGTSSVSGSDSTPGSSSEKASYEVTFDTQGGPAVTSQTIEEGGKVEEPEQPVWPKHRFIGWYKESACENAWNFETDTVTGALTLYALWEETAGEIEWEVGEMPVIYSDMALYNKTRATEDVFTSMLSDVVVATEDGEPLQTIVGDIGGLVRDETTGLIEAKEYTILYQAQNSMGDVIEKEVPLTVLDAQKTNYYVEFKSARGGKGMEEAVGTRIRVAEDMYFESTAEGELPEALKIRMRKERSATMMIRSCLKTYRRRR